MSKEWPTEKFLEFDYNLKCREKSLKSIINTKNDNTLGYILEYDLDSSPEINKIQINYQFVQRKKQSKQNFSNFLLKSNSTNLVKN